ncbi:FAD-dependent oxidoreductase [Luteimicrobium subarcticum]|uniref:Salicylate hydroxylase n=1 Tax=Luteimicrobium subarcticum TaxID=620910 RepID=A0A2M8WJS4_9MICO|nr:FAD-dependent oxidoreductase [Luteimicrobium subarcticum]PJI91148.1 salicylate hydroxylase [Luteimicrobium subarcticum]
MDHDVVFPTGTTADKTLIVGGGISGLAAALALRRQGKDVTVVEQAPEFGEIGAGLQLGPNATRILDGWGLLDQVRDVGVEPGRLVLKDAVTGDELAALDLRGSFRERYGAPYVVIHRTDLHSILLEACRAAGVELATATRIAQVSQDDAGTVARADDGRVFEAAVTLGADGLRSALRDTIVGDEVVPSGFVAYRGTVPTHEVPEESGLDDVVCWVAPDAHVVQYRLRGGSVLNVVATFRSPGFARGEADYGTPDELEAVFAACHPRVREAVSHVGRQRRWPLFDREPAARWSDGRVVLVGDAAHPMLQYLAQGCCQALEDAQALELLVAQQDGPTDWLAVVRELVAARADRTAQVQQRARVFGDVCHAGGAARLLRNALLAHAEDLTEYTDWLYAGTVAERLATPAPAPALSRA